MAHYAFLNDNNIVTEVIVGRNEDEVVNGISDWEEYYGNKKGQRCIRTSYNSNIRNKYASIGDTYDEELDAFIAPQPFESWSFNQSSLNWDPPISYPNDEKDYMWNEDSLSWEEILAEES